MEDGGDKKIRVFFSIHIPAEIGANLLFPILQHPHLSVYPPENLHITLKFIGDAGARELEELERIGHEVAERISPVEFTIGSFNLAEDRLRAQVKASIHLHHLYNHLVEHLERAGIGKIHPKSFHPHVTLARIQENFREDSIPQKMDSHKFIAKKFGLFRSEPGEDGMGRYTLHRAFPLRGKDEFADRFSKIVLPTRTQPDTLVAIFLLKKFAENRFPGIRNAEVDFWQVIPPGETEESLSRKGIIVMDLGGGRFDHHAKVPKTTASNLIAEYLGIREDPSLAKLLEYAERDDFYGKGTISADPIDRAFGLSALIAALNKSLVKNPARVVEVTLPLFIAHHNEEMRRTEEMPKEFQEKLARGEVETFEVRQRDKKLKAVILTSESGSMAGYLRSKNGGAFDVVAQWLPSGHLNILTRPTKHVDLRSLAAVIRIEEATRAGLELEMDIRELARFGRINEIPEWYYDPATNSIQNGGLNPKEISPTKISREDFRKILELGLSEKFWDPRTNATQMDSGEAEPISELVQD
ncbi:MAG: 2'-5' RNA ligase [Parcubacteria group bacterium GW2011_GWA2_45_30]|nr:MAG: 2'-5' RNA ligase [Parcubacteria group bacterium GW2011_GWA2_45_30]